MRRILSILIFWIILGFVLSRPNTVSAAKSCVASNNFFTFTKRRAGGLSQYVLTPKGGQRLIGVARITCDGRDISSKNWVWNKSDTNKITISIPPDELESKGCSLSINLTETTFGSANEVYSCSDVLSTPVKPTIVPKPDGIVEVTIDKDVSWAYVKKSYRLWCTVQDGGGSVTVPIEPLKYDSDSKTIFFDISEEAGEAGCSKLELKVTNRGEASEDELTVIPNYPCKFISDEEEKEACIECMGGQSGLDSVTGKVWTVFGCLDTTSQGKFFDTAFKIFIYILGGIIMLLTIYASALVALSQGDAEKLKTAKSIFTAIAGGAAFIIFSIMLMKFIGLTLLDLPTLKTTPTSGWSGGGDAGGGGGDGGGGFN